MGEMLGILLLGAIGWAFWQQRRQAELAWQYMRRYCQHHDLQLLSLARTHRALGHKPLRLLTYYQFEFSSDGESHYQGQLCMQGLHVAGVVKSPKSLLECPTAKFRKHLIISRCGLSHFYHRLVYCYSND